MKPCKVQNSHWYTKWSQHFRNTNDGNMHAKFIYAYTHPRSRQSLLTDPSLFWKLPVCCSYPPRRGPVKTQHWRHWCVQPNQVEHLSWILPLLAVVIQDMPEEKSLVSEKFYHQREMNIYEVLKYTWSNMYFTATVGMETPCLEAILLSVRSRLWNRLHPPQASTICHVYCRILWHESKHTITVVNIQSFKSLSLSYILGLQCK